MFHAAKVEARDKAVAHADELQAFAREATEHLHRAEHDYDALLAEARATRGIDLAEEAAQRLLQLSAGAESPDDPSVVEVGTVAGFLAHAGRLFPAEELYQRCGVGATF